MGGVRGVRVDAPDRVARGHGAVRRSDTRARCHGKYPDDDVLRGNPSGTVRTHFDLFVNVRPSRSYDGIGPDGMELTIFRRGLDAPRRWAVQGLPDRFSNLFAENYRHWQSDESLVNQIA